MASLNDIKFECLNCGKTFSPGDERKAGESAWDCFPGTKHTVAPKTYYMADAPHVDFKLDPEGLGYRSARTQLHVVPEDTFTDNMGKLVRVGYPPATFVSGRYETSDPQFQYYLEHGSAAKCVCAYDRWFAAYHTPKQRQNIKDAELSAREESIKVREKEVNRLLESVSAGKAAPVKASK